MSQLNDTPQTPSRLGDAEEREKLEERYGDSR
jgi:hypothetical protein